MNRSFSLIALDLSQQLEGHILKTLKDQIYLLDKRYAFKENRLIRKQQDSISEVLDKLYGENIQIQAVVGKNGSGKSSILEVIYRVINNFSYTILKDMNEPNSLIFSDGLRADLYYQIGGIVYCISCYEHNVGLCKIDKNGDKIWLYSPCHSEKKVSLVQISKYLFYTIVTNYAPQSMISNDYICENNQKQYDTPASWMQYLFHKNDGYMVPICLAPFRDVNGAVNMVLENELTQYRLSAIYLYFGQRYKKSSRCKDSLIDDYEVGDVHYTFNQVEVFSNFSDWTETSITANPIGKYKSSMFAYILQHYDYWDVDLMNTNIVYLAGCVYLVTKILNIINTYPKYRKYKHLVYKKKKYYNEKLQHRDIMVSVSMDTNKAEWVAVLREIDKDDSHITYKLHQTKSLLNYILNHRFNNTIDWIIDHKGFSYDKYVAEIKGDGIDKDFGKISKSLPPSFFDIEIKLKSKDEAKSDLVSYNDLSSGERQYLCVLSTYVYHILNLKSVYRQENRAYYRNIMLVMDEVEICFHPDYQRQFISRLLKLIFDFSFNENLNFYIFLSTHSPFILSDVPQHNILYLENGKDVSNQIKVNPFCANVNDILFQSFFLTNGFSGAFATEKVKSLMKYLKSEEKETHEWSKETAKIFIDKIVGDPFLSEILNFMLNNKPTAS